jgi:hypothetical protein
MTLQTKVKAGRLAVALMNRVAIAACTAALSSAAYAQTKPPISVPVVTPTETHMGVAPTEHVNLGLVGRSENDALCGPGGSTFTRTLADGTAQFADIFVVPAGKALVVTDIGAGAIAANGSPWSVGTLVTIDLRFGVASSRGIQWQKTVVVDAATAAAQSLWLNERVLGGVVFGPGQVVCMRTGLGFGTSPANAFATTLNRLHGYLTPYTP